MLAAALVNKITKIQGGHYATLMPLFKLAIRFQESPGSPTNFADAIQRTCDGALSRLVGGYLWKWNL